MIALDTETFLIGPGALAPKVVCASQWSADGGKLVSNGDPYFEDYLLDVILNEDLLAFANPAFDLASIMFTYPGLTRPVLKALEEDRVKDVQIREMLLNLGRFGDMEFTPIGGRVSYTLEALAKQRVGLDLSTGKEGDDIWRLRYNELDGLPSEEYPKGARSYALLDAQATFEVYWHQERRSRFFRTEGLHVRAAFANYLKTVQGLKIDKAVKERIQAEVNEALDPAELPLLYSSGLVTAAQGPRPYKNGAKAHRAGCVGKARKTCNCPVKMSKPKPEKVNVKDALVPMIERVCAEHGFQVKKTKGSIKHVEGCKKGETCGCPRIPGTATDAEFIKELAPFNPVLEQYQVRQDLNKLRTSYLPALEWPFDSGETADYVHPRYTALLATGRTSSRGNSKKNAKKAKYPSVAIQLADPRVRGVYTPEEGNIFCVIDYKAMELCSLAQTVYDLFGFSVHRDQINSGLDCHTFLGAVLAFDAVPAFRESCRGSTEDELAVYHKFQESEWHDVWRKNAKPVGLGYPGGMGLATMVKLCASYGWKIDKAEAKKLKNIWLRVYPGCRFYLDWVGRQGEIYESPGGMIRAGCNYTQLANGNALQTPGAEGMKEATWLVTKACYSPGLLSGCIPRISIHDELVIEIPKDERMKERADALSALMVQGMSKVLPDVRITAEPELKMRWTKTAKDHYKELAA